MQNIISKFKSIATQHHDIFLPSTASVFNSLCLMHSQKLSDNTKLEFTIEEIKQLTLINRNQTINDALKLLKSFQIIHFDSIPRNPHTPYIVDFSSTFTVEPYQKHTPTHISVQRLPLNSQESQEISSTFTVELDKSVEKVTEKTEISSTVNVEPPQVQYINKVSFDLLTNLDIIDYNKLVSKLVSEKEGVGEKTNSQKEKNIDLFREDMQEYKSTRRIKDLLKKDIDYFDQTIEQFIADNPEQFTDTHFTVRRIRNYISVAIFDKVQKFIKETNKSNETNSGNPKKYEFRKPTSAFNNPSIY